MLCFQCERLTQALQDIVDGYYFVDKDKALVIRTRANAMVNAQTLLAELKK